MKSIFFICLLISTYCSAQMRGMLINGQRRANDTIAIAFNNGGATAYDGANWNNHTSGNSSTTNNLVYLNGVNSGMSVTMTSSTATVDNGAGYCSSGALGFPAGALRYSSHYGAEYRSLNFANVPNGTYTITVISSRSNSSGSFQWGVGPVVSNIVGEIQNNCTEVATGQIEVTTGAFTLFLRRVSGPFQFINAMYLIRHN